MRIIKLLSFIFVIVSLTGCAQKLPPQQYGYGLIGAPVFANNSSGMKFIYRLELRSSKNDAFSIIIEPNNNDVSISSLVPAGEYLVDQFATHVIPDSKLIGWQAPTVRELKKSFNVTVTEGEIAVLPFITSMQQKKTSGQMIQFLPKMLPLTSQHKNSFEQKLRSKNADNSWSIRFI